MIPPIESTQLAMVVKDPLGVVGCIVPWNYPLLLLAWKVAPALAAGNCVVCKPSELTPLSTLMLARRFEHLPAGVVSLLAGAGDVGAAIAAHPDVDCIAFTGSVATGKKVAEACIARMARMNLEMGGKDAFIVCADVAAKLEVAARGGAWAAFLNAGQVCTSAERFYVVEEVFDEYVEAFVEHTRTLVLGDPFEVETDIGPMVSDPQRAKVVAQLEAASAAGAEILVGGDDGGISVATSSPPLSSIGAAPDSALLPEETFGPVAPIVPVGSLDEAIELANGTEFGLGANVYTGDLENAVRCMRELRAGTVWINDPLTDNDAGPFGGFKQSGLGRELGREGLEAFQETKHVHMESRIERKEWWYPYKEYGSTARADPPGRAPASRGTAASRSRGRRAAWRGCKATIARPGRAVPPPRPRRRRPARRSPGRAATASRGCWPSRARSSYRAQSPRRPGKARRRHSARRTRGRSGPAAGALSSAHPRRGRTAALPGSTNPVAELLPSLFHHRRNLAGALTGSADGGPTDATRREELGGPDVVIEDLHELRGGLVISGDVAGDLGGQRRWWAGGSHVGCEPVHLVAVLVSPSPPAAQLLVEIGLRHRGPPRSHRPAARPGAGRRRCPAPARGP